MSFFKTSSEFPVLWLQTLSTPYIILTLIYVWVYNMYLPLLWCRGFVTPELMLLQYYIIIIVTIRSQTSFAHQTYIIITIIIIILIIITYNARFTQTTKKENCNIRKTIIIGHTPRARQSRDTNLLLLVHIKMIILILWFRSITTTMMIIIII